MPVVTSCVITAEPVKTQIFLCNRRKRQKRNKPDAAVRLPDESEEFEIVEGAGRTYAYEQNF